MQLFPILAPGESTVSGVTPLLLSAAILGVFLLVRATRAPRTTRRALALLFVFSLANTTAAFAPALAAGPAGPYLRAVALVALIVGLIEAALTATVDLFLAWRGRPFSRIIRDTITLAVAAVVLFAVLRAILGVNLTSLLATSAVLSVVIGLALQDTLGNFFAGLALQMEQPLKIRDWVGVDSWVGEVIEVSWRSVKIRTLENDDVVLPNAAITRTTLRNFSTPTTIHRHAFRVGAPYSQPPNAVIAAITSASRDVRGILPSPPVQVILAEYGDSAIIYEVRFWVDDFPTHLVVAGEFQSRIWYRFRRAGIEFPFPTRTLHMAPPAEEAAGETAAVRRALDGVEIFSALTEEERRTLAGRVGLVPFGLGEAVIRQGEPGDSLFIILSGAVSVRVRSGAEERQVSTLGPGDVFGEMSLLTGEPRAATVIATTDVEAAQVTRDALAMVVSANPAVLEAITAILQGRRGSLESALRQVQEASAAHRPRHDLLASIRGFFGLG